MSKLVIGLVASVMLGVVACGVRVVEDSPDIEVVYE